MEELKRYTRGIEVSLFISVMVSLGLLCVVIFLLTDKPNKYDVNNDGEVDIFDIMEISDYILEYELQE